jgi:hypothetical protein
VEFGCEFLGERHTETEFTNLAAVILETAFGLRYIFEDLKS